MKLSLLHENVRLENVNRLRGWRSYPNRGRLLHEVGNLTVSNPNDDTYWSYDPILYYGVYAVGPSIYSNIIEALFDLDDVSLSGFGDGQPIFSYLTRKNDQFTAGYLKDGKLGQVLGKLPLELRDKVEKLRLIIFSDPQYNDEWSAAGSLPKRFVSPIKQLLREIRTYLSHGDMADEREFNYDKPLTTVGQSKIVGIYEFRYDQFKVGDARGVFGLPVDSAGNKVVIPDRLGVSFNSPTAIHVFYRDNSSVINPNEYVVY